LRFDVKIDGVELGSFTGIDGLSAEYDIESYEEGGVNGYVHRLPGRLKYSNVRLTRPVDQSSKALASWFGSLGEGKGGKRYTAKITAFDDNLEPVAEWSLVDVCPVKYSGPTLSTEGGRVAIETLEFAHHGFAS
jgi:phage tail-like protein